MKCSQLNQYGRWILALFLGLSIQPIAFAANIYSTGTYTVTTQSLSCNKTPAPCYDASCQVVLIQKGTTFDVDSITGGTKPWGYSDLYQCWVRMSTSYLSAVNPQNFDIWSTGLYSIKVESLACNVSPEPCYDTSCQLVIIKRGTTVSVNQIDEEGFIMGGGKPWGLTDYGCWIRMSSKYLNY
ncbi:MAG: hypothetical protein ACOVS5_19020 [Oligoflexus sp.]|jgi:hypothetical protein